MVGEDVEIETDPPVGSSGSELQHRRRGARSAGSGHRQEGGKRSALDSDLAAPTTTKNPRLSPEVNSGKLSFCVL